MTMLLWGIAGCAPGRTGPIAFRLVDAPADGVTSIVVTIDKVEAHIAGSGWQTVVSTAQTVDLLTLQSGGFATLGITTLPAGRLTQVRLHVAEGGDNHVVTAAGQAPLFVPSGTVKIVGGINLEDCATGNITLDFNGQASLEIHDANQWILRPVVQIKSASHSGRNCGGAGDDEDGGMEADDCANVTCASGQMCDDGTCKTPEMDD